MADKVFGYLGFAIKSGNIIYGLDRIEHGKKRYLLIMDDNAGANTTKAITRIARENGIPLLLAKTPLEQTINKVNCKVIAVTEKNLARAILENYDEQYIEVK